MYSLAIFAIMKNQSNNKYMKPIKSIVALLTAFSLFACDGVKDDGQFVRVQGVDLIKPDGEKLFILGTNLGNWLNPEGYMFGFSKTNSPWMINQMFSEMVGPDAAAEFWSSFKDNYITREDIEFIASTGSNTIRLPFNYKLFTDEDYMGLTGNQDGFKRVDDVISWCREFGLYLILDMHDCPGGQTGDNIDDSYGYPWLMVSEKSQQLFCDVWKNIASRYKDEPVVLGYELMNEPIATYFEAERDTLNSMLEPLYKRAVAAIRTADKNHIVLLGGAQWNGTFTCFSDWKFDDKIMYTCHRYGGSPTEEAFQNIIQFRDSTGLPMYMGETGHNSMEWQHTICQMMRDNNIGYTFWPYKKVDGSCFMGIKRPEGWNEVVVAFSEAARSTYSDIRAARPDQKVAVKLMNEYIENARFSNCVPQEDYIESMGLRYSK